MNQWSIDTAQEVANQAALKFGGGSTRLLRFGSNGIFALDDRLIIRVSRPSPKVERGVRFARAATRLGLPVLVPKSDQVREIDGALVTLWPFIHETSNSVDYEWLGSIAAELHRLAQTIAAECNIDLGHMELRETQLHKVQGRIAHLSEIDAVDHGVLAQLGADWGDLQRAWDGTAWSHPVVVHGDLYGGNVIVSDRGSLLIDFDQIAVAPRAWDHIPIDVQVRRFGLPPSSVQAFRAGYGEDLSGDPGYELLIKCRELASISWIAELAVHRPDLEAEVHQRLASYTDSAPTSTPWQPY